MYPWLLCYLQVHLRDADYSANLLESPEQPGAVWRHRVHLSTVLHHAQGALHSPGIYLRLKPSIMHREPFILQVFVCVSDFLKICLHVTSLISCPSKSPSTVNSVPRVTDMLTGKLSYNLVLYYTVYVWVCGRDPKHPWGPHSGGLYEGVLYCIVDVWVCGRDPEHPWGPLGGGLYEGEYSGAVPAAAGARTRLPRHPGHPGPRGGRKTTRRSGNNVRLLVYSTMSKMMQHWTLLARSEDRSLGPAYNEWNYTKELVLVTKFYDLLLVAVCLAVLIIRGTQCNYFQEKSRNDSHSETSIRRSLLQRTLAVIYNSHR